MNALALKDLAAKTHRGLRGRVETGRSGGGNSFGYDLVIEHDSRGERVRGGRVINHAEALVVQRIFREFIAGKSPRRIAAGLKSGWYSLPIRRRLGLLDYPRQLASRHRYP